MDCCGSSKPKEPDKDMKAERTDIEKNPVEKEQAHGGGCYGGGSGMWLHLVIMLAVFIVIWYFSKG